MSSLLVILIISLCYCRFRLTLKTPYVVFPFHVPLTLHVKPPASVNKEITARIEKCVVNQVTIETY